MAASAFLSASIPAPGIAVHAARLVYDGQALFDELDFALSAGHCTCLLGPSGVGKSSLLRLLAGLLPGAASSVTCDDGQPLAGRAAYMAQQDLLLPWLSVLDNVLLGYRLRGQPLPREAAAALLTRIGLGDRLTARPDALSGGMRQRVALARTLIEDRPVILMDEPFSALDAVTRIKLQTLAAALLRGRTVLLVTHDPLEALRLGHRIHVMTGRPARLSPALEPPGATPRDVADPEVLRLQGELLKHLAEDSA
jgi:putative hydroxymethylpyrimidine transport system ATP-binding protein